MKDLKRVLFSSRYLYIVFSMIALFFSSYVYFQYKKEIKKSHLNLEKTINLTGDSLMKRLKTIDKLYYLLEKQIDIEMYDVLDQIAIEYEQEEELKSDYSHYIQDFPFMDIYVINSENRIIYSTDLNEIGLDFSKTKNFYKKLNKIRNSGFYFSDRINLSTLAGEITKYSYYPSSDKKYIFEAGYKMDRFEEFLDYDALKKLGDVVENSDKNVKKINFYNYQGLSFAKDVDLRDVKEKRRLVYHNYAIKTNSIKKFTVENGVYKTSYLYYPYKVKDGSRTVLNCTLELVYSNQEIVKEYTMELIHQLALIIVFASFLLAINFFFRKRFILPLEKVLQGIDRVRGNDFSQKVKVEVNNEVKLLADHFNKMVESIDNLLEDKEAVNKKLSKALTDNEKAYLETVKALAASLEVKDEYTGGHCERVTAMSMILAEHLKLPAKTKRDLKFGSLLHDIGKIGIVDRVLNKPGSFTDEEYAIIKQHPEIGYEIIKNIEFLESANEIVLNHHERIDGLGYPNGLKKDEIPYLARILSITDAFDAMTSKRVYKDRVMTVDEAFNEMKRCRGTQFDSELLQEFIKAYKQKFGTELKQNAEKIEVISRTS